MIGWTLALAALQSSGGLEVRLTGEAPDRKIAITSPGVYRAVLWQASGGGIMEFHDLAADPEAKLNLAGWDRGLFEVGWHGQTFKGSGGGDCCRQHILDGRKDPNAACSDGCRDWPSIGHKALKAEGELEVIEKSPARVRVRAASFFTWWSKFADREMPVTAVYTFYPTGRIALEVRVRKTGGRPFLWSREYGPHLFVAAPREKPELNPGFTFSTPRTAHFPDGFAGPAEELVLAASPKVKTAFLLTIPPEPRLPFDRHWRHDGRSVRWDRAGYGSPGILMEAGYDSTWACMIEMGTAASAVAPEFPTPREALPFALQYRTPPRVSGAESATDDAGDFNHDGFNESEGCFVLRGPGPLALTFERGAGAGFAPAFKVAGWKGEAPPRVEVAGRDLPAASAVVEGNLILQVLGRIEGERATLRIGR
jgi:hypothetical protein